MNVDVLIVGQGISGTLLSWFLFQEKKSFLILDDGQPHSSSKVAAGIINPVTGRRYATTWMAEELLPWARQTYEAIGAFFNNRFISEKTIIDFFPTGQMRKAFINRLTEANSYLSSFPDQNIFNEEFYYEFGCGQICPAYMVQFGRLLQQWRRFLKSNNAIVETAFDENDLVIKANEVRYGDVSAEKIIFCNGIAAMQYRWFRPLPFAANKGEALLIEAELPRQYIFKKSMLLAPLEEENLFWLGASYEWDFAHAQPSSGFAAKAENYLKGWLKKPFRIVDHLAAIRPATLERRPFVGFHPVFPAIGLLNGLGTKGASLAPYFAHQLVQNLIYNFPIAEEASLNRFHRILSK